MTFTAPMFWYHQGGPRAHQLPDARSDTKGRAVLRKIRAGYATISPQRTGSPEPRLWEPAQPEPAQPESTQPEPLIDVEQPAAVEEQQLPAPPEYESLEPPPYAQPLPAGALPGYTALPEGASNPARDLKQPPTLAQRKRYRDVLRRRLTSTRKIFGGDSSSSSSDAAENAETEPLEGEGQGEGESGVVLYRGEDDQWVRTSDDLLQSKGGELQPRQRGFKAWLKRTWDRFLEWSDEHPYLFLLALFVIVVVVICVLI